MLKNQKLVIFWMITFVMSIQSSSVVTAVRNPVARQLFSVSKAFHNVNKFFQRK